MDYLSELLPVILYFLLGVLVVVVIFFFVKLIDTLTKTNLLLDDLNKKSKSLDGLFNTIDEVSESISSANTKIVTGLTKLTAKLFRRNKRKNKMKEFEEDE